MLAVVIFGGIAVISYRRLPYDVYLEHDYIHDSLIKLLKISVSHNSNLHAMVQVSVVLITMYVFACPQLNVATSASYYSVNHYNSARHGY